MEKEKDTKEMRKIGGKNERIQNTTTTKNLSFLSLSFFFICFQHLKHSIGNN